MNIRNIDRRFLLKAAASGLALGCGNAQLAFGAISTGRPMLVVILRGAMDGLGAVPYYGSTHLNEMRGKLLPPPPGAANGALALSEGFALHPSLSSLHNMFKSGEASILHATAMPHNTRSHFEAQDWMELGGIGLKDGWLNRALQFVDPSIDALGIGQSLPLILQGKEKAASWAPATLPSVNEDTISRLMDLYADDALLGPALSMSLELDEKIDMKKSKKGLRGGRNNATPLFKSAANLLANDAADIAVLSISGWDTHAGQGAENGTLARRLSNLDNSLLAFKTAMGTKWNKTAVMVMTEFGRTVRPNGTKGTDHGTASAAFLLGGAVNGGKVLGDWPGLAASDLYENRDLKTANDLRGFIQGVLHEHLQIERQDLTEQVFPGTSTLSQMSGLIRT